MTLDLTRALDAMADRASVDADPVPVDHLLTRLRRRRAARAAAASGLTLVTVAAVALAAVAMPDRGTTPPAQTQGPTPEPTVAGPTEPWPSAVRLADDVTCGTALPHLTDPDGTDDVRLDVEVVEKPVLAGGSVTANALLVVGDPEQVLHGRTQGGVQLVAVRDGIVVAVSEAATPSLRDVVSLPGPGVATVSSVSGPLVPCDGATALAPGDYQLLAWQTFTQVTGAAVGRDDVGLFGDAVPLRLTGSPVPLRVERTDTPRPPACGDPFALTLVDSAIQRTTGGVRPASIIDGVEYEDPTGAFLVVDTAVAPAGGVDRVAGDLVHRTYLVDGDGRVAFWDDPALAVGTDLWSPTDCRTGTRLEGTYRAVSMAITYAPAGSDLAPVVEIVELPAVLLMAPPDLG